MQHQSQSEYKQKALLSVKKARGTLEKVIEMIDADEYCPEVIQQVDAVNGLLMSAKKSLLLGHLKHCVEDRWKADKEQTIKELAKIFDLK